MPNSVTNWFGNITSQPAVIVEAASVDDIIAVLKNADRYPSPVRAVGSNHSTSPCGAADGGTLIKMSKMNAILEITSDTVTAQGGAIYIDVAQELEKHQLQFYVNTEIGSLSAGSAACCGTKDASMPGEYGQVNSYINRIKMVLPSRRRRTNKKAASSGPAQSSSPRSTYWCGIPSARSTACRRLGWPEFLSAYNQFCSAHGGIPLFNQTDEITRAQVEQALGDRLKTFAAARRVYDPSGRLLNAYFREMLGESN